jgi:arylsulfatase A-like enzyme
LIHAFSLDVAFSVYSRSSGGIVLIALTTALCAVHSRAQSVATPNFLLIVTDDQRPDTIHALGNPTIVTPHLDTLVRRGTAFTRAIAAIPHCVPSRAEIMTGATGFRNGSPPFGRAIKPEMALLANVLSEAGYHTWYSGKWMNDGTPKTRGYQETRGLFSGGGAGGGGLTHPTSHNGRAVTGYLGWTFKHDDGTADLATGIGLTPTTDRHIADGAIEFLRRETGRPFFLHVNFTAPHDPLHLPPGFESKYDPAAMPLPPNYLPEHPFDHGNAGQRDEQMLSMPRISAEVKREIAAYYAVLSHLDEQVGRILAAVRSTRREENTLVIFTSDHGLALGSHGLMGKQNMYDHTIGVPFVMAGPGVPANRRLDAQIYLRDVFPTLCEFARAPVPATVEGRSLRPLLSGERAVLYPEVYGYWQRSASEPIPTQRMVRTDRWKLIHYAHLDRYQLFDLQSDPHERNDLAGAPEHAATREELQGKMSLWFAERLPHR